MDGRNTVAFSVKGGDRGRPEIDRVILRDILLDSLPSDMIKWGSKVKKVEPGIIQLESGEERI